MTGADHDGRHECREQSIVEHDGHDKQCWEQRAYGTLKLRTLLSLKICRLPMADARSASWMLSASFVAIKPHWAEMPRHWLAISRGRLWPLAAVARADVVLSPLAASIPLPAMPFTNHPTNLEVEALVEGRTPPHRSLHHTEDIAAPHSTKLGIRIV